MARAKRTDRAEARRRHRAQLAIETGEVSDDGAEPQPARRESPVAPSSDRAARRQPPAVDSSGRITRLDLPRGVGFFNAMRMAYQPWDVRGDIKLVRPMATQTHAVWVPAALAIVAGLLEVSGVVRNNGVLYSFASLVLAFPSSPIMVGPFIAGVLTPRGGWLAGLLAALTAWLVTVILVATGMLVYFDGTQWKAVSPDLAAPWAIETLTLVPFGAAVGAFAAWYRRFLAMSSPGRGSRPAPKGAAVRGKPAPRRR